MRLKIGSKFTWKTQKHHVLGFVEDQGQQMIVAKYWRGASWGYDVIPVWLFDEIRARDRARRRQAPSS